MKHDPLPSEAFDHLMADFLQEYEASPDPAAVLRRYREAHPDAAAEFSAAISTARLVDQARPAAGWADQPRRLGDFEVTGQIALGGMGEVLRASSRRLGRPVVIKVIRRDAADADARERFLNEQKVQARLHHTNILPLYEAGEEGDLLF